MNSVFIQTNTSKDFSAKLFNNKKTSHTVRAKTFANSLRCIVASFKRHFQFH